MLRELGTDVVYSLKCPGKTLIGRGKSCDIQPESTSISKQHAAIISLMSYDERETQESESEDEKEREIEWWIEDLGSRNGTSTKNNGIWINIPSNGQRKLISGDLIKFGHSSSIYVFEMEENEEDSKESVFNENSEILQEREPLSYQPEILSNSIQGKNTKSQENPHTTSNNKLHFSIEYPSDQISNYPPISVQVGGSSQFQSNPEIVNGNAVSRSFTRTSQNIKDVRVSKAEKQLEGESEIFDEDVHNFPSPLTSPLQGESFLPQNEDDYDLPPPTYSDNDEMNLGSLEVLGVGMRDRRNHPGNFSLPNRTQSLNFPQKNIRDLGGSLPTLNERHPPLYPVRSSSPLQFQTRNPPVDIKTWKQSLPQLIDHTSPSVLTPQEITQIQASRDELAEGIKMANKILGGVAPYDEWKKYAATILSKTQPPEPPIQTQSMSHESKSIPSSTREKVLSDESKFNIAVSSDVLKSVKEEKSLDSQSTSVGILSKLKANLIFLLEYESGSNAGFPVELFNNILNNCLQLIAEKLFTNNLFLCLHNSLQDEKVNGTSLKDFIELKFTPRIQGLIAFNETIALHTNTPLPLEMGQLYQINKHICSNLLEDIESMLDCLIQLMNTVLNENTQLSKYLLKKSLTQFELQPKNSLEGISAEYSSDGELKIISSQPSPRQSRESRESFIRNSVGAELEKKQKKNGAKSLTNKSRDKPIGREILDDSDPDRDSIRGSYHSSCDRGSDQYRRNRERYHYERESEDESDQDYYRRDISKRENREREESSKIAEKKDVGISQALWEKLNRDHSKETISETLKPTPPPNNELSTPNPPDLLLKFPAETTLAIPPSIEEVRVRNIEQKTKSVLLIRRIRWKLAKKSRNGCFYRWKLVTELTSRSFLTSLGLLKQKEEFELERERERLKREREIEELTQSYKTLMEEKENELGKIKSLMTKKAGENESKEDEESQVQRKLRNELEEKEEEIKLLKKKQEALSETKNQIESQLTKEIDNLVRRNSVLQESGLQTDLKNQQKILVLKVLSSRRDRFSQRIRRSFSTWKRFSQEIHSRRQREFGRKRQLTRVFRLLTNNFSKAVSRAFRKWELVCRRNYQQKILQITSETETVQSLKTELMTLKEELLFLRQTDMTAAHLEAERALNREISSANLDLQQRFMTVESKLLELAMVPASERKELVRDVLLDRENEVSRLRRENRSLREQIHRLELALKSPSSMDDDDDTVGSTEKKMPQPDSTSLLKNRNSKPRDIKGQRRKKSREEIDDVGEAFGNEEIELSKQEAMRIVINELRKLQLKCQELEREKISLGTQLFDETSRYQHQTMALRLLQQRLLEKEGDFAKLHQSLIKKYGERETHKLLVFDT